MQYAYDCIMCYSDKQRDRMLEAFQDEELESVTFYAVTRQDGKDKKLIEFEIEVDWDAHTEHAKLTPIVSLKDTPVHQRCVTLPVNIAVNTYLKLFEQASVQFPDCESEDWYRCSKRIRADKQVWDQTRRKLGLALESTPLVPYSDEVNENPYDTPDLSELKSKIKTYF